MKVEKISLRDGYLIARKAVVDAKTDSGFEVEENSDDFLVHAEVVNSATEKISLGMFIIFHVLDAQEFRDGSDTYLLVRDEDVVGTYNP